MKEKSYYDQLLAEAGDRNKILGRDKFPGELMDMLHAERMKLTERVDRAKTELDRMLQTHVDDTVIDEHSKFVDRLDNDRLLIGSYIKWKQAVDCKTRMLTAIINEAIDYTEPFDANTIAMHDKMDQECFAREATKPTVDWPTGTHITPKKTRKGKKKK